MTSRQKHKATGLAKGFLLPVAALLLGACNGQTAYHAFRSLPDRGWLRQDTVNFQVEVPDSFTTYSLYVEVRNNAAYPYRNLPLSVTGYTPDSLRLPADTFQLMLADTLGRWNGQGWGGLYQAAFQAGNVSIGKAGTYRFQVAYTLPDTLLKGISDVGIRLDRSR